MRRGYSCVLAVVILGWVSPSLRAQYYNPYSPPMYNPMQGYVYPNQMMRPPVYYAPTPMGPRPAYYYPMQGQPLSYYQPRNPPGVYNYGPLLVDAPTSPTSTNSVPALPNNIVKTNGPAKTVGLPGPNCGPGGCNTCTDGCNTCNDGCNACTDGCNTCNDGCAPKPPATLPPPHPRGHFVGMVGLEFLVPYPSNRTAFSATAAGAATNSTNFPQQVEYAPFFSLGYVFHNGWGVRGDFMYMHSDTNLTTSNATATTVVTTPGTLPFQLVSPGAALLSGIGADQFTFTRAFDFKVADLEVVKECSVFDMFFTFGAGARYAQIIQSYSATRVNPGGINALGTTAVAIDHEDLAFESHFQGFGPTLSMELVHPIKGSCFSFYSNLRGSALFGIEQFHQEHNAQNISTVVGGVPVSTSSTSLSDSTSHRTVPMADFELGIQIGKRFGSCYLFGRVGAVYSRWWDVGNPLGATGNLDIVGGAAKIGIVY